jgi:hypothetical protein
VKRHGSTCTVAPHKQPDTKSTDEHDEQSTKCKHDNSILQVLCKDLEGAQSHLQTEGRAEQQASSHLKGIPSNTSWPVQRGLLQLLQQGNPPLGGGCQVAPREQGRRSRGEEERRGEAVILTRVRVWSAARREVSRRSIALRNGSNLEEGGKERQGGDPPDRSSPRQIPAGSGRMSVVASSRARSVGDRWRAANATATFLMGHGRLGRSPRTGPDDGPTVRSIHPSRLFFFAF